MTDKTLKVRTSITIDPELLTGVRASAAAIPQSVSAYIEAALRFYRKEVEGVTEPTQPILLVD